MFVIFSGVSGAGKQTIINEMMKIFPNTEFVKSATTRQRREGEDDIHYFISKDEFLARLDAGEFFESVDAHGQMYGILNADLQNVIDNPQKLFFKDVDVIGTQKLIKFLRGKVKVLTIFLECPDDVLFERLLKRGESEERAKIRLSRGTEERKYKNGYDFVVENVDLKKATKNVEKIIKNAQKS